MNFQELSRVQYENSEIPTLKRICQLMRNDTRTTVSAKAPYFIVELNYDGAELTSMNKLNYTPPVHPIKIIIKYFEV